MSTNYLETISTMVEVGLGWSVLPETLVRDLHVMPFEEIKIERELGVYTPYQAQPVECGGGVFWGC